jgi:hypothetical protein
VHLLVISIFVGYSARTWNTLNISNSGKQTIIYRPKFILLYYATNLLRRSVISVGALRLKVGVFNIQF